LPKIERADCARWEPEVESSCHTIRTGWQFTREFEHASVWVDLETQEAKIKWAQGKN